MARDPGHRLKAYNNPEFMSGRDARPLRILSEYVEPLSRFERHEVNDTIVFLGSARLKAKADAEQALREAEVAGEGLDRARRDLEMSRYYEAARELAARLTRWSKGLESDAQRFVVCTGGGPGIMEAANRGASEAKGVNVGLTISIPLEEFDNPYVTRGLDVHFHYFFMRKFWFLYLAKAVLVFPGGFGTLDELFEILTMVQTRKMRKRLPIVLFGTDYWDRIVDFDELARHGTIDARDVELMHRTDSIEDAFEFVTGELLEYNLDAPGARL
ncbi:LOG family protein [Minwuia thermotolerans]|uniref:AMP nucleosidase n=1 Tax=Minwuia thermotolerans TaxID=2056226 RepID=A0A2M9FVH8_9PROT|nr:LOG family protein [Minwuia thermotolerans]PJK27443.1 lysine decarboxylase [Minwuia thermotolerans]